MLSFARLSFARVFIFLIPLLSTTTYAEELSQWQSLYQSEWYPTDPVLAHDALQYIEQKYSSGNLNSLKHLPVQEQKQLALAALLYLRGERLKEFQQEQQTYAHLVIELGQLLHNPLYQAEGYLFLAENSQHTSQSQEVFTLAFEQAKAFVETLTPQESNQQVALRLALQLQERRIDYLLSTDKNSQAAALIEQAISEKPHTFPAQSLRFLYLQAISDYQRNQPEQALDTLYDVLRLIWHSKSEYLLPKVHQLIGLSYLKQDKYELAIDSLHTALESFKHRGMTQHTVMTLRSISQLYLQLNKPNEALSTLFMAQELETVETSLVSRAANHLLLVQAFLQLKEPNQALHYIQKLEQVLTNASPRVANSLLLQGQLRKLQALAIQQEGSNYSTLITQAEMLQQEANENQFKRAQALANEVLLSFYQHQGLYEKANQLLIHELQRSKSELKQARQTKAEQADATHQLNQLKKELNHSNHELKQSKTNSSRYRDYAIWLLTALLFSLSTYIGLFKKLKLSRSEAELIRNQARKNPATGLANERQLYDSINAEMDALQHLQENWYSSGDSKEPPSGKLFVLLRIPKLLKIYDIEGMEAGRRIEKKLGQFFKQQFGERSVFQIRDDLFGLILPGHQPRLAAKQLFKTFAEAEDLEIGSLTQLSLGVIQYPLIGKASKTADFKVVSELLLLAINAASQLRKHHATQTWVALEVIDAIPITLFGGRLRDNLLLAIEKGFIKVLTDSDKTELEWPPQTDDQTEYHSKRQPIVTDSIESNI